MRHDIAGGPGAGIDVQKALDAGTARTEIQPVESGIHDSEQGQMVCSGPGQRDRS